MENEKQDKENDFAHFSRQEPEFEPDDLDLDNFSQNDEDPGLSFGKKIGLFIFEIIKVVLISLAIILPVRMFLIQPFYVEGASMEPNFYENEYLIIDEISYRFNEPQRGEVIIFKNPRQRGSYFIKRVIGLPGEEVSLKEGRVYIDGQILAEEYISHFSTEDHPSVALADDQYFILGDNRINSFDSRQLGPIAKSNIIGRVWVRGWPFNRLGTFNLPQYP
ncbi:MAG: signal peptidase I [Patescibacteria group bacterium]|nr:signal peptidase I [Patescibacteria group bacterium]